MCGGVFARLDAEVFLEEHAEVFDIDKSGVCSGLVDIVALQQEFGCPVQSDEADELLRPISGERLESVIEKGTAHGHFPTECVDFKVWVR